MEDVVERERRPSSRVTFSRGEDLASTVEFDLDLDEDSPAAVSQSLPDIGAADAGGRREGGRGRGGKRKRRRGPGGHAVRVLERRTCVELQVSGDECTVCAALEHARCERASVRRAVRWSSDECVCARDFLH